MKINENQLFSDEIQLSSVIQISPRHRDNNDSIIRQLDLLDQGFGLHSPVTKIQSFIYAQEFEVQNSVADEKQFSNLQQKKVKVPHQVILKDSEEQAFMSSLQKKQLEDQRSKREENQPPAAIKSIRQQLIEQNKILEKKLKNNQKYKDVFSSQKLKQVKKASIRSKPIIPIPEQSKVQAESKPLSEYNLFLQKLQEQYDHSNIIKLYNFIMSELPKCKQCQLVCDHLVQQSDGAKIVCKQCLKLVAKEKCFSFIGILYDLQNKGRFEDELSSYQQMLESITKQIQRLKIELTSLQDLSQKVTLLKSISRKNYKEVNESKYYLKKHISDFSLVHAKYLQKQIPKQYLQQMSIWREINQKYTISLNGIYEHIFKIMPIYLHQHQDSKILNALYNILNYQQQQSVRISVSEHIKFPLKKMETVQLVVDGAYNLPVFDNVKHLELQFQNKKTYRQLSILFSNFPRYIYSLSFTYDHKVHSHISAENFPFLKSIAPFSSIKKLNITIANLKDFADLLKFNQEITPKIQLRLKVSKHLFSQQQLILPELYFDKLFQSLGPDLVKLTLELPQSIDSQAKLHYSNYISLNKLCWFKIIRGEKDRPGAKAKILQEFDEKGKIEEKKRELVFKKLLCFRIQLLKMVNKLSLNWSRNSVFIQTILNML